MTEICAVQKLTSKSILPEFKLGDLMRLDLRGVVYAQDYPDGPHYAGVRFPALPESRSRGWEYCIVLQNPDDIRVVTSILVAFFFQGKIYQTSPANLRKNQYG